MGRIAYSAFLCVVTGGVAVYKGEITAAAIFLVGALVLAGMLEIVAILKKGIKQ